MNPKRVIFEKINPTSDDVAMATDIKQIRVYATLL